MRVFDAPIQAVTVYTNRAKITRRGTVYMRAGEQIVTLVDLPMSLESDSVRATSTDPRFKIIDLEVKVETIDTNALPGVAALQTRHDELSERQEALLDEDAVATSRLSFLHDIRKSASRGFGDAIGKGSLPLEQMNALMEFISHEEQAIQQQRRTIAKQRRHIGQLMNDLQAKAPQGVQLKRVDDSKPAPSTSNATDETMESPPRSNSPFSRSLPFSRPTRNDDDERPFRRTPDNRRKTIELLVRAEADDEFPLTITYAVTDAKWEPFYDIRVVDDQDVTISFMGQVQQHTGEDWPAVPLTLSTSRPVQNASMPKLRPWVIDAEDPEPPRRRFSSDDNSQRRPFSPFGRPSSSPPPTPPPSRSILARLEPPSQSDDGIDLDDIAPTVTFEVLHPIAIPSDNTPRKADIDTLCLPNEIDCIAIPSQAEIAYLCAKIRNTTERTLLQGTALIFYNAQYIGKTEIKMLPPKDSVTVQIGGQEHIRVQRQLHEHSVNKSLDEYMRRTEFIYRISVTNEGRETVSLTVFDHIPITRNKNIKVMVRAVAPQPMDQSDMNIFRWKVDLEAGQRQEIVLGFAVEHPRDMKIVNKR